MTNILVIQDIHTFIGQFHILQGVSFEVPQGSVTVLLGRNGAGKTTTLRSIMGLWKPTQGAISFMDQALIGKHAYDIAQLGVGYVPEYRAIFRQLSVAENLKIAERKRGQLNTRRELIFGLFPDLKRLYNWPAGQLSGGQQQMLAIARALVPENSLLLIDEPSEGLAPVLIEQMMDVIRRLSDHTTVLLVEQNFRVASQLGDYYAIIEDGRSVHHGLMKELVGNQELIQRYLGAA
ncbi:MAG TPA: ABC transporter ATP-binding protein [Anaerolineales bacterium]|nr:ABC transporter ATP-binding protein [Anaerolineales bacterium]